MKKKIMFLIPNLSGGGAEKVLVDILNNLNKDKYDITLILLYKKGVYLNCLDADIKIKYLTEYKKVNILLQKILIIVFPRLYYIFKVKGDYDIEIAFLEGLCTKLLSRSLNKNKIAWVHIDFLKKHWTKKLYLFQGERYSYSKFKEIIFVSNDAKTSFNKVFNLNEVAKKVINNPIIEKDIIEKANKEKIKFNEFTIVSVGRLNMQKGYDLLIEAHSRLVKKYKHKLVIIGEGEERENLKKNILNLKVEESVVLRGFEKNPYPYIKAADLVVSSSRAEGYPLVMLESVVLEKAIVATNITGNREIFSGGKYCLMCECNVDDIEKSIERIFKEKNLIRLYEEKSKRRKKDFEYKKILKEIESLL